VKTILLILSFYVAISAAVTLLIGLTKGVPVAELPIEVLKHPRTSFTDEAMNVILQSTNLHHVQKPQLLVLGASGAQEAWIPSELQPKLPALQVNNLAVGAANLTEMDQALDHCLRFMPPDIVRESWVLLGLSYPLFVPDKVRWQMENLISPELIAAGIAVTDLEREAMRSPMACDVKNPVFKSLPLPLLFIAKRRCAYLYQLCPDFPVNPGEKVLKIEEWRWQLPAALSGDASQFPPPPPPITWYTTPRGQMDWLTGYMGTAQLQPEQFQQLRALIRKARSAGLRVAIADMPLPTWHRAESPFAIPCRAEMEKVLADFSPADGVHFIDLSPEIPDDEFRDSIHPTEHFKERWTSSLARKLQPLLEQP
jgi:hypothetical protein